MRRSDWLDRLRLALSLETRTKKLDEFLALGLAAAFRGGRRAGRWPSSRGWSSSGWPAPRSPDSSRGTTSAVAPEDDPSQVFSSVDDEELATFAGGDEEPFFAGCCGTAPGDAAFCGDRQPAEPPA